jgi:O-antigen ligase
LNTTPPKRKPAIRVPLPGRGLLVSLAVGALGALMGLCLLKFGTPPIMAKFVTAPADFSEFIFATPWPVHWAFPFLVVASLPALACLALKRCTIPDKTAPGWVLMLPILWLLWQIVASRFSIRPDLSNPTLLHFFACLLCFYAGYFVLGRAPSLALFWAFVLLAFVLVLMDGWEQHFGGLEATRRYFNTYLSAGAENIPPELLKKIQSNRIFSTLFYPNALAGAMLLLFPPLATESLRFFRWLTLPSRVLLIALLAAGSLGCLYWSGSKTGWLLMLLMALVALSQSRFSRRFKISCCIALAVCGLTGFFIKHASFFEKGATSLGARMDYWHAALITTRQHPLVGTGPGTFAVPYAAIKKPESEMARLTHNDYLEQASDSGVPGFLLYTAFILGSLIMTSPWSRKRVARGVDVPPADGPQAKAISNRPGNATVNANPNPMQFAIWLGLLGWCLQGFLEFGLYLPALAWPAFACMGILWAWRR